MTADEPCFYHFLKKKAFFMSFAGEKKSVHRWKWFPFLAINWIIQVAHFCELACKGGKNDYVDEFDANVRVSEFVIY